MKRLGSTTIKFAAFALCAAGLLASAIPARAQLNVSTWNQILGDPAHTSHSTDPLITTSSSMGVKWMANMYSASLSSPVVAYNSTLGTEVVYQGDERGDVYALNANTGAVIWSTNVGLGDAIRATPVVASDGTVWVGTSYNATLFKLNGATGAQECSIPGPFEGVPLDSSMMDVTPPGGVETIYWAQVATRQSSWGPDFATNEATCAQIWEYEIPAGSWATATYGVDGAGEPMIYWGTASDVDKEYAFDANTGTSPWNFQTYTPTGHTTYDVGEASTFSPPGNNGFADGAVYVHNEYGSLTALDATTGAQLWFSPMYPKGFPGKQYSVSSSALDGNNLVQGFLGGISDLNATTGATIWNVKNYGIDASPAIIGPSGSEVVAFGDLTGVFNTLSLSSGATLYTYQTGGYIVGSPAEYNGMIYEPSTDGFLYAFAAGGGNGTKPSETGISPSNTSTVANPNGNLSVSGTSTDKSSVKSVGVAIQENGSQGSWWDASTSTWGPSPVTNAATVASPGSSSTTWTFAFPVPPAGGNFEAIVNTVNGSNLVDSGSKTYFTVSSSTSRPNITPSQSIVPPGTSITATGAAFEAGETVNFTLLGATVASATVNSNGNITATTIPVSATAPFGPTSLEATGVKSGKSATYTLYIDNSWSQAGYNSLRDSYEPNDQVIGHTINVSAPILGVDWMYHLGAGINSAPAIADGVMYFGDDAGLFSAIYVLSGGPDWSYSIPSGAEIRGSPAIDASGNLIFGANDGNLYVLSSSGSPVKTISVGGNVGAPAYSNGTIIISSSTGTVESIADPGFTTNWSINAGSAVSTAPAFDPADSLVFVGTSGGKVTAYNSTTGAVAWQNTTGGSIGGIAVYKDNVYAGSADGNIYSYNETTGTQKWKFSPDGSAITALSIYEPGDGPSYGTADSKQGDISPAGVTTYTKTYGEVGGSPVAGLGGAGQDMFGTTANGYVQMARQSDGGYLFPTKSVFNTGPVELNGMLFAGDNGGNMYALVPNGYTPPPVAEMKVGSAIITVNGGCTPQ